MFAFLFVAANTSPLSAGTTPFYKLEVFDATPFLKINDRDIEQRRKSWDEQQLLAAIQGIVNRDRPRLYVYAIGRGGRIDRYWLEKLRRPGQWLAGVQLREQTSLRALVGEYRSEFSGAVVWDERVPATALVASTAAGAENLLPIRYDPRADSLYTFLTAAADGPRLPVKLRLLNADGSPLFTGARTGSAKCEAVLWAVEHFLKTGKCNALHLAYYPDSYWIKKRGRAGVDQTMLFNHDYFISQRAFFFDLSPWNDEAPNDEPGQKIGADSATLLILLRAAHDHADGHPVCVGGFIPWTQKYTQFTGGRHEPVSTEWRYADILSCFDGYMDGDAPGAGPMANASVFCHFPLADHYPQRPPPSSADLQRAGFLDTAGKVKPANYATIYVGDYDSAAWLYQMMPEVWDDPNRGKIPLGWAFDPSLEQRFPVGLAYARATASPNDSFIAGDSGYGYLNPSDLVPPRRWSNLPSGLSAWQELCQAGYQRWDLRITGFVITGSAPAINHAVKSAYTIFSPDGVIAQQGPRLSYVNGVPFIQMAADVSDPVRGAEQISQYFPDLTPAKSHFGIFRTILWTPTKHKHMFDLLRQRRPDIHIISLQTLMKLAKLNEKSSQE